MKYKPWATTREDEKKLLIENLSDRWEQLALYYDDVPEIWDSVTMVRSGLAIISRPYVYDVLEEFWYYGNWNLIAPAQTDFEPINTFKLPDAEIKQVMCSRDLSLIIDSFHDNIEWKVNEILE